MWLATVDRQNNFLLVWGKFFGNSTVVNNFLLFIKQTGGKTFGRQF